MPDLFRHPPSGKIIDMRERQPCVYIMTNRFNGTIYTGVTFNLIGRVRQHRDGHFGGFTGDKRIHRLVWFEMTDTMDAAVAAEKRIKRWRREWNMNVIERDNPHWDDLAVGLGLEPLDPRPGGPRHKAGVTGSG
ncbi:GIY-YIG nuclease family protein [Sphingomonas sp. RS2018]